MCVGGRRSGGGRTRSSRAGLLPGLTLRAHLDGKAEPHSLGLTSLLSPRDFTPNKISAPSPPAVSTQSLIPKPFCRSTWTTQPVNSCLRPRNLIALRRRQIPVCSSSLADDHHHSPSPCLKSCHHPGWCSQLLDGLSLQLPWFSISNLPSSSLSPDTTSYAMFLTWKSPQTIHLS